jgi:ferredoxin
MPAPWCLNKRSVGTMRLIRLSRFAGRPPLVEGDQQHEPCTADRFSRRQRPRVVSAGQEWTVEVDRAVCVGNRMCVDLAPDAFAIVDGKSSVLVSRVAASEDVAEAYASCPVSAILVRDGDGNEIDPQP